MVASEASAALLGVESVLLCQCGFLVADSRSFGAVVLQQLFEPLVLESLLSGDPLVGVVDKYLPEEVKELPIEIVVRLYGILRQGC